MFEIMRLRATEDNKKVLDELKELPLEYCPALLVYEEMGYLSGDVSKIYSVKIKTELTLLEEELLNALFKTM